MKYRSNGIPTRIKIVRISRIQTAFPAEKLITQLIFGSAYNCRGLEGFMTPAKERRSIDRQVCKCEVELSFLNKASHVNGQVLNFNREGGYLETARPLSPRASILIRVKSSMAPLPDYPKGLPANAVAEVKWCRELSGRQKHRYGVGVRYHFPP